VDHVDDGSNATGYLDDNGDATGHLDDDGDATGHKDDFDDNAGFQDDLHLDRDSSSSPEPTETQIEEIRIALQFIEATKNASLDDETNRLGPDATARLRNPTPNHGYDLDDPDLRLSIEATSNLATPF
jgi:hypothetical protein